MTTELLHELASDARLLNAFDSGIAPIFNRLLNDRVELLRVKVRMHKTDEIITVCAEIALLKDLINEIEVLKRRGAQAIQKLGEM